MTPAGADGAPAPSSDAVLAPHRAVIDVQGMVCSFCAQGVEKALARLPGLDRSAFRDGVLVEIEAQRVTLALEPGAPLQFGELRERILSGGYEPGELRVWVHGRLSRESDRWILDGSSPKQRFEIGGDPALNASEDARFVAAIDLDRTEALPEGAAVPARVHAR